jgi:hypothetical protein
MTLSTHRRPGTGRHLSKSPSRWVPMLACSQSLRQKRCLAIRITGTSTALLFFSRQSPQFAIRPKWVDAIMVFLSLQSVAPPGRRYTCPRRFDAGRVPPSSVFQDTHNVFQDTHKKEWLLTALYTKSGLYEDEAVRTPLPHSPPGHRIVAQGGYSVPMALSKRHSSPSPFCFFAENAGLLIRKSALPVHVHHAVYIGSVVHLL